MVRWLGSKFVFFLVIFSSSVVISQTKPHARDLGIPFDGTPGPNNAITDVKGVEVGHTTLISGDGKLVVGQGPVRTGVTAIHPRGKNSNDAVFAAWFTLNGNGEMTGTTWIEESGFLEGPIALTMCSDSNNHECILDAHCRVKPHIGVVGRAVRGALGAVTLTELAQ